jgi:hypothetical protein
MSQNSFMFRPLLSATLTLALAGCIPPPRAETRAPAPRTATDAGLRQCTADLDRLSVRFTLVPDQDYGGGCSTINTIALTGVGVPVTNIKAVQCPLARAFVYWARGPLAQAARAQFGTSIVRIETMGAYSCRNVIGRPQAAGTRSEHATGNALDVSGFVLANGRRVTIETGWNGAEDEQQFLRTIRAAACKSFQTVLSPDYNAAHYNHLHFDMGKGPYCH